MEINDAIIAVMQEVINIMQLPFIKYPFISMFICFTLAFVRINIINTIYALRVSRKKRISEDDLDTAIDKYDDDRG